MEIQLTSGLVAHIDDEDWDKVKGYKWYSIKMRNTFYVRATIPNSGGKKIYLHRLIMDEPEDLMVDHKDGNGLNNKKYNLRECTNAQNQRNKQSTTGSSKYKGVYKKGRGGWTVEINTGGKKGILTITGFHTEEGAAKHYDKLALKYHGEFARLNFSGEK